MKFKNPVENLAKNPVTWWGGAIAGAFWNGTPAHGLAFGTSALSGHHLW